MELARPLRAAATRLAKSLGGGYSAVHLRLPDASAGFASRQKGLNVSALPALLQYRHPSFCSAAARERASWPPGGLSTGAVAAVPASLAQGADFGRPPFASALDP